MLPILHQTDVLQLSNVTVNVNQLPTINLTSGSNNQSVCLGQPIGNITYAIGGSATNATITGLPTGVSGNYNSGVFTISGTPTQTGLFNYTITTVSPCTNVTATGTISVGQAPTTTGATTCQGGTANLTANCTMDGPFSVTNFPTAGTGGSGGTSWNNLPSGITNGDLVYSAVQTLPSGSSTQTLTATGFNFTLPITGTVNITNIQVSIDRMSSGSGVTDQTVQLIVNGAAAGLNKSLGATWQQGSIGTATFSGAPNGTYWGVTPTVAQINAGNFGVALVAHNGGGGNRTVSVDDIKITITYTVTGTVSWYTAASGGSLIGSGSPLTLNGGTTPNTNTPGTVTYYAECSNAPGCRAPAVLVINPKPNVTVSPNVTICNGASTPLTASGANTYSWSPATGLSATTGATVTASPTTTTTYTVIGTDGNGCTNTAQVTVTVNPKPTITVTPAAPSICFGSSVSLTASGASTYSWSPGTGLSATTGATVTANPTTTTTYTVTGTDANSCVNTANVTVTVTASPTITLGANPSVCVGATTANLSYSATTGAPNQYSIAWSGGPLANVTNAALPVSPIHITIPPATPAGTYTGTLTVTNSTTGCVSTGVPISVTINPSPSVTLGPNISVCQGTTSGNLSYTVVSGIPDHYTIFWGAGASGQGFANVINAAFTVKPYTYYDTSRSSPGNIYL